METSKNYGAGWSPGIFSSWAYTFIAAKVKGNERAGSYLRTGARDQPLHCQHRATVRQAAQEFSVSKSTVHKDMAERLLRSTPVSAKVRAILDQNKAERHLRGGAATRKVFGDIVFIKEDICGRV